MGQDEIINFLTKNKGLSFTQTEIKRYLNLSPKKDISKFLNKIHDFGFIKLILDKKGRFQYSWKED